MGSRALAISAGLALGWMSGASASSRCAPAAGLSAAALGLEGQHAEKDVLLFKTGKTVEGKILAETDTTITIEVWGAGGLKAKVDFAKADILKIERGVAADAPDAPKAGAEPTKKGAEPVTGDASAKRVYVIQLEGEFGEDITQTPIRSAVEDARANKADYLVFVLNNDWILENVDPFQQAPDDTAAFDEIFRAEEIIPIFQDDIPLTWEKQPEIVFIVKQAMGGAALLPLICENLYFTPGARLGGLGNATIMFGSTGDEVVRQKQYSLRVKTACGWAALGGYPCELVHALADFAYTLSYKSDGDRVVWLPRLPQSGDEHLLTDDGKDANADTMQERVRSQGNDFLTLTDELAKNLQISKGTVTDVDDVIFATGIGRNYVRVDQRSKQIMEGWSRQLDEAKKDIRRLAREYAEIQVQGNYKERTQARGQQLAKIGDIQKLIKRYGEGISFRFYRQYGIPDTHQWDVIKEQIKQQQLADKPDR